MTALAALSHRDVDDERWDAVLARDRRADALFLYAVTSTGVFCRPSCPSRRPRRDRVRFFASPGEAQQAGFRACRRCRPLEPTGDPWIAKVERACRQLANTDERPPLATLAAQAGSSRYHFLRNFQRIVGVSPREFADARRFEAVKRRLREPGEVTAALFDAGYGSSSRFYERAVPKLAMTPVTYRDGGRGQAIRYAVAASPIGRLLVGATAQGICRVELGNSDETLVAALQAEYPHAQVVRAQRELQAWVKQVVAGLTGRIPKQELPLDVRGTAFQWQVWKALMAIPRGETRTYGAVARAIGRPSAARAVARACASNPVALVVPCHRVVPTAGGVGGYRWGAERKQRILARERRASRRS